MDEFDNNTNNESLESAASRETWSVEYKESAQNYDDAELEDSVDEKTKIISKAIRKRRV